MGDRRAVLIWLLVLCLAFSVFSPIIVFASSENWVEVTRFYWVGSGSHGTRRMEPFTCDRVEWRIRWRFYFLHSHFLEFTHFSVRTYPVGENTPINEIIVDGWGDRNGTAYIFDNKGEFYMQIGTLSPVTSYTVIVEQNFESIPEFPSWIPQMTMLVTLTAIAVIYKQRIHNLNHRRS